MAKLTIGVDAGGTGTSAALARDGEIVRRVDAGPGNATTIGLTAASDAIVGAVREVAGDLRPDAIYIGAAGAGRAAVAKELESRIAAAFPGALLRVADDAEIALRALIPTGPGIVLIAGTGSVALADDGERLHRVGGLGWILGDEGSAAWMGLQAMKLLGRVYDGRALRDETTSLVARHLEAPDRDSLIRLTYVEHPNIPQIAALAPSIIAFAGKGNRVATKITQEAARELGELLRGAAKAANMIDSSPMIALSGGLVRENSLLTFLLETRIVNDIPGAQILRGGDPLKGAIRCADRLVGAPAR